MKTYKTPQKAHENRIVAELNANVLTSTFLSKEGKQKADVYRREGSPVGSIVAHGTCAPIGMKLEQTVMITF